MKSITIKGSEKAWEKLRLKPYVMLERFLACYTEEINQYIFQQEKKHLNWCILKHTVVIELGNGKSFNAIMQDIKFTVSDKILP
jgi:large subunit ribosomal protein L25